MRAELAAVEALLTPWGKQVFYVEAKEITDATGVVTPISYPYVLLWGSPGLMRAAEVDGVQDDLDDVLGVTTVALTPDACLKAVDKVRGHLLGKQPLASGRHVQPLRLMDSQRIQADTAVTVPSTNTHPYYGVDIYRLISEPAEEEES